MTDAIIEIDFKGQPLEIKRKTFDACPHSKVYVWENDRKITCQSCEAELDPFQVLLEMAYSVRKIILRDEQKVAFYEKQAEKYITWQACRSKISCAKGKEKGDLHGVHLNCPSCGAYGQLDTLTLPGKVTAFIDSVWYNNKMKHWECSECWLK